METVSVYKHSLCESKAGGRSDIHVGVKGERRDGWTKGRREWERERGVEWREMASVLYTIIYSQRGTKKLL